MLFGAFPRLPAKLCLKIIPKLPPQFQKMLRILLTNSLHQTMFHIPFKSLVKAMGTILKGEEPCEITGCRIKNKQNQHTSKENLGWGDGGL